MWVGRYPRGQAKRQEVRLSLSLQSLLSDRRDQRGHNQSSMSFLSFVHLLFQLLRRGVLKSPTLTVMCFSPFDPIDLSAMNFEFLLLAAWELGFLCLVYGLIILSLGNIPLIYCSQVSSIPLTDLSLPLALFLFILKDLLYHYLVYLLRKNPPSSHLSENIFILP